VTPARRILVVDDDDTLRELVAMALSDEGYQVRSAAHGAEALEIVGQWPVDLILLDMRMPVMDGWEFSQAYRMTPGPHAPVVALTAGRDVAGTVAQIEADGFLAKPFDLDGLLELVAGMLSAKGAGGSQA
jgi:CheY-like chemotaxis protein